MTTQLDSIHKAMVVLHKEIQERQTMLASLVEKALAAVREEETAIVTWRRDNNVERAPVHHVANADPAKMQVLTVPRSDK